MSSYKHTSPPGVHMGTKPKMTGTGEKKKKKKNSCRHNWMSHCLLSSSFIFLSFTGLVFTVAALCMETHRILIWTDGWFCGQNLNTIWRDVKGESLYRGCCCSRLPPEATVEPTENLFTQWRIYMHVPKLMQSREILCSLAPMCTQTHMGS